MDKTLNRAWTIGKIERSIAESTTLEQLASTEQFLYLYYKQFFFDSHFLKHEWLLDNQIRRKKKELLMWDEVEPDTISFSLEKMSLRRLNTYVKSLSTSEFQTEWLVLQSQFEGIDILDISIYPDLCEKIACLKMPRHHEKQLQVA